MDGIKPVTDILSERPVKRSVTIAGHATSITLEAPFWTMLQEIAAQDGRSLANLITEIDARRGTNLSSALRLFVLDRLRQG
ncbi:MAG: ribbon-helix-helix domain-containing protein [Micavibrio sp.]